MRLNLRDIENFIKGYGSILNLIPNLNDEISIKQDVKNVAQDFWFVIQKEETKLERKQQGKTA